MGVVKQLTLKLDSKIENIKEKCNSIKRDGKDYGDGMMKLIEKEEQENEIEIENKTLRLVS